MFERMGTNTIRRAGAVVAAAALAASLVAAAPAQAGGGAQAGLEPANVQVVPGDGTLTVTWEVSPRAGFADDEIRHALRWSQVSGVWANPKDPRAGGAEDGIVVEGGVTSYTITGLTNGVATGVFVRSFTGSSHSERAPGSSLWVRTKGTHTTPGVIIEEQPAPQAQTPPERQAQPQTQTLAAGTISSIQLHTPGSTRIPLTPEFAPSTTTYTAQAPAGTTAVVVGVPSLDRGSTYLTVGYRFKTLDSSSTQVDTATINDATGFFTGRELDLASSDPTTLEVTLRRTDPGAVQTTYTVTITRAAADTVPGTPRGLSLAKSGAQLAVSWSAPSSDGGAPITGYEVEYKTGSAPSAMASTPGDPTTGWAAATAPEAQQVWSATLTPGATVPGLLSGCSNTGAAAVRCTALLTGQAITYGGVTYTIISISYNVDGGITVLFDKAFPDSLKGGTLTIGTTATSLAGLDISKELTITGTISGWSVGGTVPFTLTVPGTATEISGVSDGTAYDVRVRAVNGVGEGQWAAATATATPQTQVVNPAEAETLSSSMPSGMFTSKTLSNNEGTAYAYGCSGRSASDSVNACAWPVTGGSERAPALTTTGDDTGNAHVYTVTALLALNTDVLPANTGSYANSVMVYLKFDRDIDHLDLSGIQMTLGSTTASTAKYLFRDANIYGNIALWTKTAMTVTTGHDYTISFQSAETGVTTGQVLAAATEGELGRLPMPESYEPQQQPPAQQQAPPPQQEQPGPPVAGQLEPYNVQVTPGDGTLTVTWSVAPRDGVADDDIRHALRWSQVAGVWANPADPDGPGRNDGITVAGGVATYTIGGLQNGVPTGVFVRSFTGTSLSERSEHSSKWVRTKGPHTTPRAAQ